MGRGVRRHTNPFDGLKHGFGDFHENAFHCSKAHKSVRRIETCPQARQTHTPPSVRRHTNPFDGLKHSSKNASICRRSVRRHTNPFDGLKHLANIRLNIPIICSKAHKSVRRIETTLPPRDAQQYTVRRHTNPFDGLKLPGCWSGWGAGSRYTWECCWMQNQ